MSKEADIIKALLAEYDSRHPGALKLKPKSNKYHSEIEALVKTAPKPVAPSSPRASTRQSSPKREPHSQFSHLRPPQGLVWTTFSSPPRSSIPVLKVIGTEYDNYAAVKNTRPPGTYTLYMIEPRKLIAYKCLAKDIKHYVEQDIKHEQTLRENLAFTKRQETARAEAQQQAFLDQPGFYIIPGETVGPDDRVYNASGPYHRFESAGFNPDIVEMDINPDDVEDEALKTANSLPNEHVKIIEARNPKDAAAGKGHIWWQDMVFRGPPVDPRQAGFGW